MNYNENPKLIDVAFLNKKFTPAEIESFNKMLPDNGLANTKIHFRQNDSDLKSEILTEINKNNTNLSEKDISIADLRLELNQYKISDSTLGKEIEILYPQISNISYGKITKNPDTDSASLQFLMIYTGNNINENQLKNWLEKRLNEKNVQVLQNSGN